MVFHYVSVCSLCGLSVNFARNRLIGQSKSLLLNDLSVSDDGYHLGYHLVGLPGGLLP